MKVKAQTEEKLKEGAKILQMIMLISQLTQTDAQPGDEERRPYGPDWTFLVLLAFAALGLVACIRWHGVLRAVADGEDPPSRGERPHPSTACEGCGKTAAEG